MKECTKCRKIEMYPCTDAYLTCSNWNEYMNRIREERDVGLQMERIGLDPANKNHQAFFLDYQKIKSQVKELSEFMKKIIIDALEQSMVVNEKQQEEISQELELVTNGYNPSKVFDNEDLESVSACMRKLAIYHEYPHVEELIEANKILERYLIGR